MTERYFSSQQQPVGVPAGAFLLLPSLPPICLSFPPPFPPTFLLFDVSLILPLLFYPHPSLLPWFLYLILLLAPSFLPTFNPVFLSSDSVKNTQ